MSRETEQNSKWFVEDIRRHAQRVMDNQRTTMTRIFVTNITGTEMDMLRTHFPTVYRDNTGHIVIKAVN